VQTDQAAEHPIRLVLRQQGRSLAWLAEVLGVSTNFVHRVLLPAGHPDHRAAPAWFYPRAALFLGVPEAWLRPDPEPTERAAA
jgi:hypothetical protein